MRKKKSTQQLVGIESVTDSSVLTAGGELTFYLVQPTNLNVLPESGVRTRVTALLNVLKTSAEMELLAIYFEQDATHEAFDLVDGARWLTAEMEEENADFES